MHVFDRTILDLNIIWTVKYLFWLFAEKCKDLEVVDCEVPNWDEWESKKESEGSPKVRHQEGKRFLKFNQIKSD